MPKKIVAAGDTDPVGYQQITDLSSAVGLTVPADATFCTIQAEDQKIRWRDDGTDPTTTVGTILAVEELFQYTGNLSALSLIETTASAKCNVSYYK